MDKLTEDGERRFPSECAGLDDGVADAETDAEMFCDNNFHLLCITKSQSKFFISAPLSRSAPAPVGIPERRRALLPSTHNSFAGDPEFPSSPPPTPVCARCEGA